MLHLGCHQWELNHHELQLFSSCVIVGGVPEAPAQVDNGKQAHIVHCPFDTLRRPSQHDRPASRPTPGPILFRRYGRQSCSERATGEQLSRVSHLDHIVIFHVRLTQPVAVKRQQAVFISSPLRMQLM